MMRRERRAANLLRLKEASPRVEVTVDELVLHGFQSSERHAIGDAFQQELERILAEVDLRSTFRRDADLPRLEAGRISLSQRSRPAVVGNRVAHAVVDSLNSSGREGG